MNRVRLSDEQRAAVDFAAATLHALANDGDLAQSVRNTYRMQAIVLEKMSASAKQPAF